MSSMLQVLRMIVFLLPGNVYVSVVTPAGHDIRPSTVLTVKKP